MSTSLNSTNRSHLLEFLNLRCLCLSNNPRFQIRFRQQRPLSLLKTQKVKNQESVLMPWSIHSSKESPTLIQHLPSMPLLAVKWQFSSVQTFSATSTSTKNSCSNLQKMQKTHHTCKIWRRIYTMPMKSCWQFSNSFSKVMKPQVNISFWIWLVKYTKDLRKDWQWVT